MKLNKKGFAISGILYSLLILFVSLFLGMLTIFASSKFSFDKIKKDIITKLSNREFNNYISSNNNCIKSISSLCNLGTEVNVMVNDTTSYNFFVINDTGNKLTLIMDRNLGNKIAWNTSGTNADGPLTVLEELELQTSNWTNIPTMSYTLSDDNTTPIYQSITRTNVRARLLNYTEEQEIKNLNSGILPNYLYTNLSGSNTIEQPLGYWLSTALSSADSAWFVGCFGGVSSNAVYDEGFNGVRPVITVFKTL